ncbi:D-glycerate dehydrogenase [candidate division WWE3 bacterium]|nr:D-glycerate dehydrogenase [candidate division WWE3 bacterium]
MKVLITRKIPDAGIRLLKEHPELELDYRQGAPLSKEELIKAIKDADAIIPVIPDQIDADIINAADNLKLIATYSVGYDHINLEAAKSKSVYVSNTPGDLTESVAEHTIALMMAVGKKIVQGDKYVREGNYNYWDPMLYLGPQFMGKTLGIVGFGRIGQHVADIARDGFNMRIVYSDPKVIPNSGAERLSLEELLETSDVISLNCNLCPATHHLIDEAQLKMMKPTAILINTARGPVINEKALMRALEEEWIEGAGLDVFEEEPNVPEELRDLKNVVLTPHIASATREARIEMATMAAKNVIEVLVNGNEPVNKVA